MIKMTISRRALLGLGFCGVGYLALESTGLGSIANSFEHRELLLEKVEAHGITLQDRFTSRELEDIVDLLDRYSYLIGDLKQYGLKLAKFGYDSSSEEAREYQEKYPDSPLRGYYGVGMFDEEENTIVVAPKKVVDEYGRYLVAKNKIALGEEGLRRDFRWSFAHEVGHAIFFNEYRIPLLSAKRTLRYNLDFESHWNALHQETVSGLPETMSSRPVGFPRIYSTTNAVEDFVDTVAYVILGYSYAQDDPVLSRKIALVRAEFERMKQYKKS